MDSTLRTAEVLTTVRRQNDALAFIETCHKTGWVLNDDWGPWSKKATEYRDHPERFASAPADRIARCLTAYLRGERFTEGVFAECVGACVDSERWIFSRSSPPLTASGSLPSR